MFEWRAKTAILRLKFDQKHLVNRSVRWLHDRIVSIPSARPVIKYRSTIMHIQTQLAFVFTNIATRDRMPFQSSNLLLLYFFIKFAMWWYDFICSAKYILCILFFALITAIQSSEPNFLMNSSQHFVPAYAVHVRPRLVILVIRFSHIVLYIFFLCHAYDTRYTYCEHCQLVWL